MDTLITSEYQVHAAIKVFSLIATLVAINICTGIFSSSYISRSVLSSDEPIPLMMLVPTILCIDALIMVAGTLAIAYARVPRPQIPSEGKTGAYTEAVISAGKIVAMDAVPVLLVKGLLYATIAYNLGSSDYFDYRTNGLDLIKSFRRQVIVIGMVVSCLPFAIAGAAILRMFTSDKSSNTQTLEDINTEYDEYLDKELVTAAVKGRPPAASSAIDGKIQALFSLARQGKGGSSGGANVSSAKIAVSKIGPVLAEIANAVSALHGANGNAQTVSDKASIIKFAVEKIKDSAKSAEDLLNADIKGTSSDASDAPAPNSFNSMVLSLLKDVIFMPNSEKLKKKWRAITNPTAGQNTTNGGAIA